MARSKITVRQGTTHTFTVEWPTVDLRDYNIYLQIRSDFASSVAAAEIDPIGEVSNVADIAAGIERVTNNKVRVTLTPSITVLLENQDNDTRQALYRADVLLIAKVGGARTRPVNIDIYVDPRTTVVE
jgi:hypothetical protein